MAVAVDVPAFETEAVTEEMRVEFEYTPGAPDTEEDCKELDDAVVVTPDADDATVVEETTVLVAELMLMSVFSFPVGRTVGVA